jgi:NMD protein affecting ribosome stability and mRNA decay
MNTKLCPKCRKTKPIKDFSRRRKTKRCSWCKSCTTLLWFAKHPHERLLHRVKYLYGLTRTAYENLVAKHKGRCAICNRARKLHIDHNHKTGNVRGLLCADCNRGLGMFFESITGLKNAIKYLKHHARS